MRERASSSRLIAVAARRFSAPATNTLSVRRAPMATLRRRGAIVARRSAERPAGQGDFNHAVDHVGSVRKSVPGGRKTRDETEPAVEIRGPNLGPNEMPKSRSESTRRTTPKFYPNQLASGSGRGRKSAVFSSPQVVADLEDATRTFGDLGGGRRGAEAEPQSARNHGLVEAHRHSARARVRSSRWRRRSRSNRRRRPGRVR